MANSGPIALSEENPYYPSNIFVMRQINTSQDIQTLVNYQGTPDAIEVKEQWASPLEMSFYYIKKNTTYNMTFVEKSWLILGPYTLSEDLRENIEQSVVAMGNYTLPKTTLELSTQKSAVLEDDKRDNSNTMLADHHQTTSDLSLECNKQNKDKLNELISYCNSDIIESSARGDINYTVEYEETSLPILSLWFTGDEQNASRLRRINQLKESDFLKTGTKIMIPSYLIRNRKSLPQEALDTLKEIIAKKCNNSERK